MSSALQLLTGAGRGKVFTLPDRFDAPYLVGRSLEANLILPGPYVAERHAMILAEDGAHLIVPATTEVPTWIGKATIDEAHTLRDGDKIRLGNHLLRYHEADQAAVGEGLCATCSAALGPTSGQSELSALKVGDSLVCPRCVDGRLNLSRRLASYRILRKITNNDDEVTYLGVDTADSSRVAVRILRAERQARPEVLRRFLVRALVGLLIEHPNFIPVRGIQASSGIPFVVVEHVPKTTKLEVLVREGSPASVRDCIYITNQLSEVMRYARTQQLVVAKRKRSGVLVDAAGWVKVLAYDVTSELERRVSATEAFADLATQAGADPRALRELPYATEDEKGRRLGQLANEFAEVYAVGRILYQLTSGNVFRSGTIDEVRRAGRHARKGVRADSGPFALRPPALVDLIERVIVPSGERRIRTLEHFSRASKAVCEWLLAENEGICPHD